MMTNLNFSINEHPFTVLNTVKGCFCEDSVQNAMPAI